MFIRGMFQVYENIDNGLIYSALAGEWDSECSPGELTSQSVI